MVKPMQMSKVEIHNEDDRLFKTYASVEEVDSDGEIIPMKEFEKIMPVVMDRGGAIIDSHSNRIVGKILNYNFGDKEGKKALKFTGKIFKDYPVDDMIWDKLKNGEYTGVSFGGANMQRTFDAKSQAFKLQDVSGFEFSVVDKPANQGATIESINHLAKGKKEDLEEESSMRAYALKGPTCMAILQDMGTSKEEAHDICYADSILSGDRESMSKLIKGKIAKLRKDANYKSNQSHTENISQSIQSKNNPEKGEKQMSDDKKIKKADELPEDRPEEQAPSMEERMSKVESGVAQILERLGDSPTKQEEEEKPEEETEKTTDEEDTEKSDVGKESGETVTGTDVAQDEDETTGPDSDSATVIKELESVKKELSEIKKGVTHVETPRPATNAAEEIFKAETKDLDPLDIAQGKVNMDMGSLIQKQNSARNKELSRRLGY